MVMPSTGRKLPPISEIAIVTMALVVIGGTYIAAHIPDDVPLLLPTLLAAAAAILLVANIYLTATLKPFAWGVFRQVFGWSLVGYGVISALLMFVFLLYLLTGGGAVWNWIEGRFSTSRRDRVRMAGAAAWNAASGYIRGLSLVAFIDSAVIGVGMLVFGTPYAGTLVLLSFVCLFIPILGAWVSGTVIVLVTLGSEGSGAALGMAVVILVAQQLDSMFVTPLVYQKTVSLHPIVTLTAVIVGSQLLGIVGAFLAVPMVAVGWAIYNALEQPALEATGA